MNILQSKLGGHGTDPTNAVSSAVGFTSTTTAGSLLILVGWCYCIATNSASVALNTPAVLNSQAWTLAGAKQTYHNASTKESGAVGIWYIANTTSFDNTHTCTLSASLATGTEVDVEFALYEVSGIATTTPVDVAAGTNNSSGSSTVINAGTLTATVTDFVIAASIEINAKAAAGSGYTLGIQPNYLTNYGSSQTELNVAAGSVPTAFGTSESYWAAEAVAFKAGTADATVSPATVTCASAVGTATATGNVTVVSPAGVSAATAVGSPTASGTKNYGVQWSNVVAGSQSKPVAVNGTYFYFRSYGYLVPSVTGLYTIGLNYTDGANLFIGTQQIINDLSNSQAGKSTTAYVNSGHILLTAGVYYPYVIEWQHAGGANYTCQFLWTPPLGTVQVVPALNLSSVSGSINNLETDAWWNGTNTLWYPAGNATSDPTNGNSVPPKGSIPPAFSGNFNYTSTTSAIVWTWTGLVIYRADGTTVTIPNSSVTESGLTSSTTYNYYPYYDELLGVLAFVNGSGVGTHGYSFPSKTYTAAQQQSLQSRVPLSNGAMQAATTASGSGGGGGGGGGSCVRSTMLVDERTKGIIPASAVCVGDCLRNRTGWVKVLFAQVRNQDVFIRVNVNGHAVEVTPTHPFEGMNAFSESVDVIWASNLSLMHQLYTVDGADFVRAIQVVKVKDGKKMVICCDGDHTFFSGEAAPYILTHNTNNTS